MRGGRRAEESGREVSQEKKEKRCSSGRLHLEERKHVVLITREIHSLVIS